MFRRPVLTASEASWPSTLPCPPSTVRGAMFLGILAALLAAPACGDKPSGDESPDGDPNALGGSGNDLGGASSSEADPKQDPATGSGGFPAGSGGAAAGTGGDPAATGGAATASGGSASSTGGDSSTEEDPPEERTWKTADLPGAIRNTYSPYKQLAVPSENYGSDLFLPFLGFTTEVYQLAHWTKTDGWETEPEAYSFQPAQRLLTTPEGEMYAIQVAYNTGPGGHINLVTPLGWSEEWSNWQASQATHSSSGSNLPGQMKVGRQGDNGVVSVVSLETTTEVETLLSREAAWSQSTFSATGIPFLERRDAATSWLILSDGDACEVRILDPEATDPTEKVQDLACPGYVLPVTGPAGEVALRLAQIPLVLSFENADKSKFLPPVTYALPENYYAIAITLLNAETAFVLAQAGADAPWLAYLAHASGSLESVPLGSWAEFRGVSHQFHNPTLVARSATELEMFFFSASGSKREFVMLHFDRSRGGILGWPRVLGDYPLYFSQYFMPNLTEAGLFPDGRNHVIYPANAPTLEHRSYGLVIVDDSIATELSLLQ